MTITFEQLRLANVERQKADFQPCSAWSPTDWACAMAGECGEACNKVKKLRRLEGPNTRGMRANTPQEEELIAGIAEELGGMVAYADLLCQRLGLNLGRAIREEFNKVSDRIGSEVRLTAEEQTQLIREVERLRVQLSGCGVAALGGTALEQVAEEGSYGWSAAYQSTLELRWRYDQLRGEMAQVDEAIARRPALEGLERAGKIYFLCQENSRLLRELADLKREIEVNRRD